MTNWKSIDSAPRDGKYILAAIKKFVLVIRYIPKYTENSCEEWSEYCEDKDEYFTPEGWYEQAYASDDYGCISLQETPTHFIPLSSIQKLMEGGE